MRFVFSIINGNIVKIIIFPEYYFVNLICRFSYRPLRLLLDIVCHIDVVYDLLFQIVYYNEEIIFHFITIIKMITNDVAIS